MEWICWLILYFRGSKEAFSLMAIEYFLRGQIQLRHLAGNKYRPFNSFLFCFKIQNTVLRSCYYMTACVLVFVDSEHITKVECRSNGIQKLERNYDCYSVSLLFDFSLPYLQDHYITTN